MIHKRNKKATQLSGFFIVTTGSVLEKMLERK